MCYYLDLVLWTDSYYLLDGLQVTAQQTSRFRVSVAEWSENS
jgi:hypothetical protein